MVDLIGRFSVELHGFKSTVNRPTISTLKRSIVRRFTVDLQCATQSVYTQIDCFSTITIILSNRIGLLIGSNDAHLIVV
jgi:hypothetical protein